jgi:hypothetical protein
MKNKLAKQLIQKYSLETIYGKNSAAIRAILDFSELAAKHERKAIRAVIKTTEKINQKKVDALETRIWILKDFVSL